MGCRVGALRYADAKAEKAEGECGMAFMRLKLGNKSAVVAFGVSVAGREEAVMRTFVNGCGRVSIGFVGQLCCG
jgi:hypothetical protein